MVCGLQIKGALDSLMLYSLGFVFPTPKTYWIDKIPPKLSLKKTVMLHDFPATNKTWGRNVCGNFATKKSYMFTMPQK